jgi:putative FmdB family regulatory protein
VPLYDYDCGACGRRFEVVHGVHADGPAACPLCGGGPVKKAFAAPAVHFKGSGWAKKERRAAKVPGATAAGQGESATGESGPTGGESGATGAESTSAESTGATPSAAKPAEHAEPAGAGTSPAAD